jgi:hypothetical protein
MLKDTLRFGGARFAGPLFLCLLLLGSLCACTESPERISQKLDAFCQADLKYIVGEVVRSGNDSLLLEKPYYRVDSLIYFKGDTAAVFSAYAQVSYHYFKDIPMHRERKYRYWANYMYWDRFSKRLVHDRPGADSTAAGAL